MIMCITTAVTTAIIVFAITGIGFAIGKLNKFGDKDTLIETENVN